MGVLATLAACAGLVLLVVLYRRDQQLARRRRGEFFADCVSVLDRPEIAIDDFGYPRLTGWFDGALVRADVVVDCLGLRKLPSLWLRMTIEAPVATGAVLDVMMRPSGAEFFSPFASLLHRLDTPADWPERAVVHTDNPDRLPPPELLAPHVSALAEPKAKELIIAPKGVRIVWQADEAQRSDYLLLRQARFDVVRFDRDRFCDLMMRCITIRRALAKSAANTSAANKSAKGLSREAAA